MIAHNASFDTRFCIAEMEMAGFTFDNPWLCSLALSRRMYQDLENYKLLTIIHSLGLEREESHRALDDAIMTTRLWIALYDSIQRKLGNVELTLEILQKLMKVQKAKVKSWFIKIGGLL